jgi:hypothetical protein
MTGQAISWLLFALALIGIFVLAHTAGLINLI